MLIWSSFVLAYFACGTFYQASNKRSTLGLHIEQYEQLTDAQIRVFKLVAWVLMAASIYLATLPQGTERGITIWIGLVSAAGFLGLFISALKKEWHLPSLMIMLAALILTLLIRGVL